jgi:hypothetical protein
MSLPSLWHRWSEQDARAWGYYGKPTPEYRYGYRISSLPLDKLPRSYAAAGGEIGEMWGQFQRLNEVLEQARPRWEPLEEQVKEKEARLNRHRGARCRGEIGLPALEVAQLEQELPILRRQLASAKSSWNRDADEFHRLGTFLPGKWAAYEAIIARFQAHVVYNAPVSSEDLELLKKLIGDNPLSDLHRGG